MFVKILLISVLVSIISGEKCRDDVKPMENYSLKERSGTWSLGAVKISEESDRKRWGALRCSNLTLDVDDNGEPIGWRLALYVGDRKAKPNGTYSIPDPKKGLIKFDFTPKNSTYDFITACSDYKTYSIDYVCLQASADEISEFSNIFVRDINELDTVLANPEFQKCYSEFFDRPVEEYFMRVPFNNC
uniref:Lipocalin/cytosolic fatty-acid binding domain-containing protein n=1 Tax=Clastoptera arizonana TaxID=38151 RepID=A0A1B6DZN7_9HEMI